METAVLDSTLVGALLLVPVVLLAGLCLSCKKHPQISIRQNYAHYEDNERFRVVRPVGPSTNAVDVSVSPGHSTHTHHLSVSPAPVPENRLSFAPTEDGSIPSYENQEIPQDPDPNKADDDASGYIEVLPDLPVSQSVCTSQLTLTSMQSSDTGDVYVNVDPARASYINVTDGDNGIFPAVSRESMESVDNDSSDYINVPPLGAY